jgi:16S rRNA U1498 N3-methylase RsmE
MSLKKVDPSMPQDVETTCSILLSPLSSNTSEEVLNLLNQLGAENIEQLASNFISAKIGQNKFPQLQEIARVEVKQQYQMRKS